MLLYAIYLIGGFLIGCIVGTAFWARYIKLITYGTLKKQTDDGETYLFLDLDVPPEKLLKRQRVVFEIDPEDIVPHK
jgi:hypothetical protein